MLSDSLAMQFPASRFHTRASQFSVNRIFNKKFFINDYFAGPEGAFKKLKSESSSLGGVGPGGGGGSNSCVGNSHLHNPSAASCPTPARRRHRTTFTQVSFHFSRISREFSNFFE